jgi:pyruvate dehydrogenase kinase 2/3/4
MDINRTQGTSRYGARPTSVLAMKAMKLKLSGQVSREVSERRQVGDAEEMFADKGAGRPWWRSVGMDEGV